MSFKTHVTFQRKTNISIASKVYLENNDTLEDYINKCTVEIKWDIPYITLIWPHGHFK